MKTYTLLSLGKIESIKNKKLCMLEDLKNGIWRHKKGRSKLYVISNEHLANLIAQSRISSDVETYPELKVLEEEIYNLLVKEQTKRITDRANTLNQINNNNNNMNEVTEVQTELNGIAPDAIFELTPANAAGIGFTTSKNKLFRIIDCKLVGKATVFSPKDRHVCLVENLDSHYFDTRFFTLKFSQALKMFNNKKSMMSNVEKRSEMKARWKTMKIPQKPIFSLMHRSDSAQYKVVEDYIKNSNEIQFFSTEKPKKEKVKQSSPNSVESNVEPTDIKKESDLNSQYFVYSNELDEDKQLIVKLYFTFEESVQDRVFPTLPNDIKTAIYERLPVSRQQIVFNKLVEKANKSSKNNG
jgi:hypothetical protein